MSQLLDYTKKMEKSRKNIKKLLLAQIGLKRIMSQLLDYTGKIGKKLRKKNRKIIFGSDLSETNNEPTFRLGVVHK